MIGIGARWRRAGSSTLPVEGPLVGHGDVRATHDFPDDLDLGNLLDDEDAFAGSGHVARLYAPTGMELEHADEATVSAQQLLVDKDILDVGVDGCGHVVVDVENLSKLKNSARIKARMTMLVHLLNHFNSYRNKSKSEPLCRFVLLNSCKLLQFKTG